jgi:biotin carboxyl carrier protein
MKMELPVRAPHDGSVDIVKCSEGEMVEAGQVLVELGI